MYGVENARALNAYGRLASVDAFECADKALVFGVMDVFQGLATSARREETRRVSRRAGAERFHREIAHHRHGARERVVAR